MWAMNTRRVSGIEGTVIEFAARGIRYLDDTKGFQRHDQPPQLRRETGVFR